MITWGKFFFVVNKDVPYTQYSIKNWLYNNCFHCLYFISHGVHWAARFSCLVLVAISKTSLLYYFKVKNSLLCTTLGHNIPRGLSFYPNLPLLIVHVWVTRLAIAGNQIQGTWLEQLVMYLACIKALCHYIFIMVRVGLTYVHHYVLCNHIQVRYCHVYLRVCEPCL